MPSFGSRGGLSDMVPVVSATNKEVGMGGYGSRGGLSRSVPLRPVQSEGTPAEQLHAPEAEERRPNMEEKPANSFSSADCDENA